MGSHITALRRNLVVGAPEAPRPSDAAGELDVGRPSRQQCFQDPYDIQVGYTLGLSDEAFMALQATHNFSRHGAIVLVQYQATGKAVILPSLPDEAFMVAAVEKMGIMPPEAQYLVSTGWHIDKLVCDWTMEQQEVLGRRGLKPATHCPASLGFYGVIGITYRVKDLPELYKIKHGGVPFAWFKGWHSTFASRRVTQSILLAPSDWATSIGLQKLQGPEGGEAVFLDGEGNIVFPGGYVEKGFMNADIHALELFPRGAPPTPTLVKPCRLTVTGQVPNVRRYVHDAEFYIQDMQSLAPALPIIFLESAVHGSQQLKLLGISATNTWEEAERATCKPVELPPDLNGRGPASARWAISALESMAGRLKATLSKVAGRLGREGKSSRPFAVSEEQHGLGPRLRQALEPVERSGKG
ncbi:hypothetical protein N2152v2_006350 [Parachlorella kessleri]